MKKNKRYFFDRDEDSHWYLVPEQWREEWDKLREIEDAWALEEWQKFEDCRIDGISSYSFENPEELK